MIYPATTAIETAIKAADLKCSINETDGSSAVRVGFNRDSFSFALHFISTDNDTDVAVRCFDLMTVPEAKRTSILTTLNELNNRFRFFKFTLDSDGDVRAEFDYPLATPMDLVGKFAVELVTRSVSIFDEVYPELMKAVWA